MTMEQITIIQPDTTEIDRDAQDTLDKANAIVVDSADRYALVGEFLRAIITLRKRIADTFDKPIKAAHAAHKAMLAAKGKHDMPLAQAEGIAKGKMATWKMEEDRKRRVEEQRIRELEHKRVEEERLAQAEALEAEGKKEDAEAVIQAPIAPPPVVLPSQTPKIGGVTTMKVWKYRIVDASLIPRNYMIPNEKAIGQLARSLKDQANIPGVEFYSEDSVRASGY